MKQKLGLCFALIHDPDLLVLDEPTTGVDPVARDGFWELMIDLARRDRVTIFISIHFMNEAERCDCISLMHAGKVLASDSPAALVERSDHDTLEDTFIDCLKEASGLDDEAVGETQIPTGMSAHPPAPAHDHVARFSLLRLFSYTRREALELRRDQTLLSQNYALDLGGSRYFIALLAIGSVFFVLALGRFRKTISSMA